MRFTVIFFEEQGQWIGQCLEKDIASQASTFEDAQYELARMIAAHIALDKEQGIEPLSQLPPSPYKLGVIDVTMET